MKEKHKLACMKCAEAWAECSNAERLKVGAIAFKNGHIIAEGYNGLAKGFEGSCEDGSGHTRQEVTHAEDNLLRKLTRSTESSVGATIFCTHACCFACSMKLVDAEISEFYYKHDYRSTEGLDNLIRNGILVTKINENKC
jgi:dCMP deaminase